MSLNGKEQHSQGPGRGFEVAGGRRRAGSGPVRGKETAGRAGPALVGVAGIPPALPPSHGPTGYVSPPVDMELASPSVLCKSMTR